MVYIPRLTFKSGINPSLLATFPTTGKYSGTQKLLLTRTRIFGHPVSSSNSSGMKPWHKTYPARFQFLLKQRLQMHNIYHDIPDLQEIADDTHVDHRGRKQYKEQIQVIKDAKKAAKQAKKKK